MHHFDWSDIPGALPALWSGAVVTVKITLCVVFADISVGYAARAGIQAVPRGQADASFAPGMHYGQAMRYVVLPQAFRAMIPLLLTQGIVLFQDTSLVYVISLADFVRTARISATVTALPSKWYCSRASAISLFAWSRRAL